MNYFYFIATFILLTGCQSNKKENSSLEKELIQLAREATKDVFIPNNIAPTIKYVSNNKYAIITWPYLQENPYPGPEFYVEVTIDKKTKKVIEVMTSG